MAAAAAKSTTSMASTNGGPANQSKVPTTSQANSANVSTKPTYASLAQPRNEDIIVLDSYEGIKNDEYLDAMEKIIDLSLVKGISKTSGRRVQIVLANESLVTEVCKKKIQIREHILSPRPLITGTIRVVISNVSLVIPNEAIIEALKNEGIEVTSNIRPLRASLSKPGRSHIMSYRREFHIKQESEKNLPVSLQITFQNTPYWTYLTTNTTACFECKQTGHIAGNCPSIINKNNIARNTEIAMNEVNSHAFLRPRTENVNKDFEFPPVICSITQQDKRPRSISNSDISNDIGTPSECSEISHNTENIISVKPRAVLNTGTIKKKKTSSSASKRRRLQNTIKDEASALKLIEEIEPIAMEVFQESSNDPVVKYDHFIEAVKNIDSISNPTNFSEDAPIKADEVSEILDKIHQHTKDSKLKAKLTRLKNKVRNKSIDSSTGGGSDTQSDIGS